MRLLCLQHQLNPWLGPWKVKPRGVHYNLGACGTQVAKRTSLSNNMYFLGRKDVNLELRRVAWHVVPEM